MEKMTLEKKILPILNYVGIIVAAIMAVAYVVVVFVLIRGFEMQELLETTVFACVNAGVGFGIMQALKAQGEQFARMIPENEELEKRYYKNKTKDKKIHSMKYFWVTSVIKDIVIKCATLGASTVGLIYIVIQGSNDYNLLWLALVNLLMFIGFGFMSLVKAYKYYNNQQVPYMKEKLKEVNAQEPEKENKEC